MRAAPILSAVLLGLGLAALLSIRGSGQDSAPAADRLSKALAWQRFDRTAFAAAAREKKLVLLHLGAGWCHWCHVMEEKTYGDPAVQALLAAHFIVTHVDQDADPAVSRKYENWGWPATIVFAADGAELVKRRGYIPAEKFRALLDALVLDPTPGPSVTGEEKPFIGTATSLAPALETELLRLHEAGYDSKVGGWGSIHKFLDAPSVEWALVGAAAGDAAEARRAEETLSKSLQLLDPVWGGLYQYSDGGVWTSPHFEKIMSVQASSLAIYAGAFAATGDRRWRDAARSIVDYLENHLRAPDGAFCTSQDADLRPGEHAADYFAKSNVERRRLGYPRVDRSIYARENGWAIRALATAGPLLDDSRCLTLARAAADRIVLLRGRPDGGFRHGDESGETFYLGDNLAMAEAFLALHEATGEAKDLDAALRTTRFLAATFGRAADRERSGIPASIGPDDAFPALRAEPNVEENRDFIRFAARFDHASDEALLAPLIRRAGRLVFSPDLARLRPIGATLLAARAEREAPLVVTIHGEPRTSAAAALRRTALRNASGDRLVLSKTSGGAAVSTPPFALVCADGACSAPLRSVDELETYLRFDRRVTPDSRRSNRERGR